MAIWRGFVWQFGADSGGLRKRGLPPGIADACVEGVEALDALDVADNADGDGEDYDLVEGLEACLGDDQLQNDFGGECTPECEREED